MTSTPPTSEHRAELKASLIIPPVQLPGIVISAHDLAYLLDATEPVADAEVLQVVANLHSIAEWAKSHDYWATEKDSLEAAALLERLARERRSAFQAGAIAMKERVKAYAVAVVLAGRRGEFDHEIDALPVPEEPTP